MRFPSPRREGPGEGVDQSYFQPHLTSPIKGEELREVFLPSVLVDRFIKTLPNDLACD
jgi:hypothetical protein